MIIVRIKGLNKEFTLTLRLAAKAQRLLCVAYNYYIPSALDTIALQHHNNAIMRTLNAKLDV